jgi:hypothetical protein
MQWSHGDDPMPTIHCDHTYASSVLGFKSPIARTFLPCHRNQAKIKTDNTDKIWVFAWL